MLGIYQFNTRVLRATLDPDSNSQQQVDLMGQDTLTLNFESASYVGFKRGDYTNFEGKEYTLHTEPVVNKADGRKYQYKLVFEGPSAQLGLTKYFTYDRQNKLTEPKFDMRAKPREFCDLIIFNLERQYPGVWTLGAVIDADYMDIQFDGNNCLEVLSTLADKFDTEFYINDHKIYLAKVNRVSKLTFRFGAQNALYSVTRQGANNSNVVTRVYAYGSSRNIGDNYRNGAQRLRLANLYVEKNRNDYPPSEDIIVNDDIYPRREGTISAITSPLVFSDAALTFDINDFLMPGVSAKLTFNSGLLQGYTFEIHSFDNATKTFTIIQNTSEQTITLPNDTLFVAVGDKYVLTDIIMPLAYVNAAEAELDAWAQTYLEARCSADLLLSYAVTCRPAWFKRNSAVIDITQSITLIDETMNIDRQIRIVGFTRNVQNRSLFGATLADLVTPQTLLVKLLNGI